MVEPVFPSSSDFSRLLTEREVAQRHSTTVDAVRWMRRKKQIRFLRIAGNRGIRFWWPHLMEDLSRIGTNQLSYQNNQHE